MYIFNSDTCDVLSFCRRRRKADPCDRYASVGNAIFFRTVSWSFSDVLGLDGSGKPNKWGYDLVRKLLSEHLGLFEPENPNLSIVGGVLSGDGKIRESVRYSERMQLFVGSLCWRKRRRGGG